MQVLLVPASPDLGRCHEQGGALFLVENNARIGTNVRRAPR